MELKEAIKKRRSIRKFLKKDVPTEKVGALIDVARYAPSAGNTQNWMVIVVKDEGKKKELATACLEQSWMNQAPVLLVICNQFKKVVTLYGKLGKMFSIQDCANFTTNLMLLAVEEGMATGWVGAFDNEAVCRILEVPEDSDPEIILALGYPSEKPEGPGRRDDIEDLVFFEKWGNRKAKEEKSGLLKTATGVPEKIGKGVGSLSGKLGGLLKKEEPEKTA
jgi:nitroreductase